VKIRITAETGILLVDIGKTFEVNGVTESHGEAVYFIHHMGTYLGIRASLCEVVEQEGEKNK
jgi:hypothetical protein